MTVALQAEDKQVSGFFPTGRQGTSDRIVFADHSEMERHRSMPGSHPCAVGAPSG